MGTKKKVNYVLDTNAWMSTFTDLMTLLLTFFVLLLSLASIDKKRKRTALNSLVGAFGFKPGGQSILGDPKGINITTGAAPIVEEDVQFERLRNVALKHGVKSNLTATQQLERTVLVLKNKILFEHKSSRLKKESMEYLTELAGILKDGDQLIEIRGYCDSSESILKDDPYKSSMLLSSQRAIALFDFFTEKGIASGDIVAHGFGLNYPGKTKKSKKSYLNRQAEIILDYREKVPFKLRKKQDEGGFLDINGFFFRTARDVNGR